MNRKRVVVACGTGIATSTVVAEKVAEACRREGIDVDIIQCKATEVATHAPGASLVVATTTIATPVSVPVINAIGFLTGVGEEELSRRIIEALKD
ncbi:MAG: PTS sugar transporter subunit IIB [Firmicutes bacterium]|nr:PTS sugar transporter subunit IIB [Bacillota bacterium]